MLYRYTIDSEASSSRPPTMGAHTICSTCRRSHPQLVAISSYVIAGFQVYKKRNALFISSKPLMLLGISFRFRIDLEVFGFWWCDTTWFQFDIPWATHFKMYSHHVCYGGRNSGFHASFLPFLPQLVMTDEGWIVYDACNMCTVCVCVACASQDDHDSEYSLHVDLPKIWTTTCSYHSGSLQVNYIFSEMLFWIHVSWSISCFTAFSLLPVKKHQAWPKIRHFLKCRSSREPSSPQYRVCRILRSWKLMKLQDKEKSCASWQCVEREREREREGEREREIFSRRP